MLAERFSRADLAACLLDLDHYRPYPTADERDPWASLPDDLQALAIRQGEELLDFEWPMLPALRFMDFARDGNRSRYEAIYFSRRNALGTLVLAECVENQGRFIDQIINGIWCICEETSWIVPAHNPLSRTKEPLPDAFDPSIDLFAADTGALLAWVRYLLGGALDRVTPIVTERIRREVDCRIVTPFMNEQIHWMGFSHTPNNWNPWCTSNCLVSLLLIERDQDRRVDGVQKSLTVLDNWLRGYAPDGGCDEGPGYWNVAGGCLFDCLEILLGATGGRLDVYGEPLIAEIGRYITRMHITGGYFVSFADAPSRLSPDGALIYRYGQRIGDDAMMAMGADFFHETNGQIRQRAWYSLTRILPEVFGWREMSLLKSAAPHLRDSWMPSIEVMTARERGGTDRGLYLAAKGGNNAESHNHNDIGNFIVYSDGLPMLIDAGVGTYTRQTFSPERYKIWTMQSAYHNLPTVNGAMQPPGRQFAANDAGYKCDDSLAELSLDIADAYPAEAGIKTWRRTCRLNRAADAFVEIVDDFDLNEATDNITLSLIAAHRPEVSDGRLVIRNSDGVGVSVEYEDARLAAELEIIEIDDQRLAAVWGSELYRVLLKPKRSTAGEVWRMRISGL